MSLPLLHYPAIIYARHLDGYGARSLESELQKAKRAQEESSAHRFKQIVAKAVAHKERFCRESQTLWLSDIPSPSKPTEELMVVACPLRTFRIFFTLFSARAEGGRKGKSQARAGWSPFVWKYRGWGWLLFVGGWPCVAYKLVSISNLRPFWEGSWQTARNGILFPMRY